MTSTLPLTRMAVAVVLAAALLAACSSSVSGSGSGSSSDTATTIKKSLAAAKSAKTLRISGTGHDSGSVLKLDVHYGSNGATGYVDTQGTRIDLVLTPADVFFKAPDSFWRKQLGAKADQVLKVVGGKWVKVAATSDEGKSFGELADRQKLISSFASKFDPADLAGVKRVGTASVAGTKTITYADSGSSDGATIDVQAKGTPYPAKIVDPDTSNGGTLTFTSWNVPYTVSPPPGAQTVTLPS